MCISRFSVIRGAFLALAHAGVAFAQENDPLPAVALRFELESHQYRQRMGAELDEARRILEDSVRRILQSRFPFVRWGESNASYTVMLRVAPANDDPQRLDFAATLIGPTAVTNEPFFTVLEPKSRYTARREWHPTVVAQDWVRAVHAILDRESPRLLHHVFGRLRIAAPVEIDGRQLTAVVRVDADSLRASEEAMPKFRVTGMLVDPNAPGTPPGPAELLLSGCLHDRGRYSCEIEAFIYREKTRAASLHRPLFRRAVLRSLTVYLLEYRPRPLYPGRAVVAAAVAK